MKRLAFLTVLVMILTLSFAFATEEPILTNNPEVDVTTTNPEETTVPEGTENGENVETPTDGSETAPDSAEPDTTNPDTPAPDTTEPDTTTPDTTSKSNSTIVGAIIAIVIVVVVIALAALIQKK